MNAEHRRALLPFLQRAEEVQKVEPKVAYYCRLYAVEEGLKLQNRDKSIDELLFSVMDKLESFKKSNTLDADADRLHLEGFAIKIFSRADRVDVAGRADMSTCKTFYAASVFLEVLTQFGPLDEDLEGKQRYAAWKAADIRKAIREGRKPQPGSGVLLKKYKPGQQVVCKIDASSAPIQGTVLSSNDDKFIVSLSTGGSQELSGSQLAFSGVAGTAVTYTNAAKGVEEPATISSMDITVWPPSYQVKKSSDGSTVDTEEKNIALVAVENSAGLPDASPSTAAPAVGQPMAMPNVGEQLKLDHLPSAPPSEAATSPSPTTLPPAPAPAAAPQPKQKQKPKPSASPRQPQQKKKVVVKSEPGFTPGMMEMHEAQKQAKFAVSSLGFQDHKSAIDYLEKALQLLLTSNK
jgi:vacuolar protein sorting-associated protein VTA1